MKVISSVYVILKMINIIEVYFVNVTILVKAEMLHSLLHTYYMYTYSNVHVNDHTCMKYLHQVIQCFT
jgi:hypothetical protein